MDIFFTAIFIDFQFQELVRKFQVSNLIKTVKLQYLECGYGTLQQLYGIRRLCPF
jgi:hypothetical protein